MCVLWLQKAQHAFKSSRCHSVADNAALLPGACRYIGRDAYGQRAGGPRGPWNGCSGKVVLSFPDNPTRVGVRFDTAIPGGVNLGGACDVSGVRRRLPFLFQETMTSRLLSPSGIPCNFSKTKENTCFIIRCLGSQI